MAVFTTNAYSGPYLANGATVSFPFSFSVLSASDVAVVLRDADGAEASVSSGQFSVSLNGTSRPASGTVTFAVPPPSGLSVILLLNPGFTQEVEFENGSAWLASPVNAANDASALRDQVLKRDLGRSMLVPIGEVMGPLPAIDERKGKALTFDPATGHPEATGFSTVYAGTQTIIAENRTVLAALTGMSAGQSVALGEAGREGLFVWRAGDLSAEVAADAFQGVHVPPASDVTGASGAWVRAWTGAWNAGWFGQADLGPVLNSILGMIGGAKAAIGFGEIHIPRGEWQMSETVLVEHQSIQFIGKGRPIITWTGAAGADAMFHLRTYTAVKFQNMVLLGGGLVPNKCIYSDDTGSTAAPTDSANAEHLTITECSIGRRWGQDAPIHTGVNNGFVCGVYFGGPNLVNNDQFYAARTQIHDCSTAGWLNAANQSIWGHMEDMLFDSCGYGIDSRSNLQLSQMQFNRNTIADIRIRDNTIHDITGFNAENSARLWDQSLNASLKIKGGRVVLTSLLTDDNWARLTQAKDLHLEDFWVDPGSTTGKKLGITASSGQRGRIDIEKCRLPDGAVRGGYAITAPNGSAGLLVNIAEAEFRMEGRLDGSTSYALASLANGASALVPNMICTTLAAGDAAVPSFSGDLQGVMLCGNRHNTNNLYTRFSNRTGAAGPAVADGQVSYRKLALGEFSARVSDTHDFGTLADGRSETRAFALPCGSDDFAYWACDSTVTTPHMSAYISADNEISLVETNLSGGNLNIASANWTVFAIPRTAFDLLGGGVATIPEMLAGDVHIFTVPIDGARLKDFVLAQADFKGMGHSVHINADGTAEITIINGTGATISTYPAVVTVGAWIRAG
jgi:hypothetical protein